MAGGCVWISSIRFTIATRRTRRTISVSRSGLSNGVYSPVRSALASTLRHHLDALLTSRIDGVPPPADSVQCLDQWLHRAWASQSLERDGQMHWRDDANNALLPLKRVALDALDLISDPSVSQLRRCANTRSCGWLFLDTSKNQRRRWCAMETCGTAVKMKRYRRSHA